jgi:hypothetical protein
MRGEDESITVGSEDERRLLLLHGLCAQAVNHVRAALVLIEAGMTRESMANARVALEHAVTAQWAHLTEDGLDRLINGARKAAATYYKAASRLYDLPDAALNEMRGWASAWIHRPNG